MNSEKVKEIKKALEYGIENGNALGFDTKVLGIKAVDILTLINELEIENERLNKSDTSKEESSIEYYNLYKDLKRKNKDLNELCELQRVSISENFVKENQLKDRIALLEKENETLRNAKVVYETVDYCYEDLRKAEDRIAELEKENGELLKENEGYHGSYRCAIDKIGELSAERYIKVEQFAERLKEVLGSRFNYIDSLIKSEIDETLKEFINEQD